MIMIRVITQSRDIACGKQTWQAGKSNINGGL